LQGKKPGHRKGKIRNLRELSKAFPCENRWDWGGLGNCKGRLKHRFCAGVGRGGQSRKPEDMNTF